MKKEIPRATIERLVIYYKVLEEIFEKEGMQLISSTQLADRLGILSVQIRKDLSYCGHFGARGIGYYVQDLRKKIKNVLGLQYRRKVAIVGAGNLGTALANYKLFKKEDFNLSSSTFNGFEKVSFKNYTYLKPGVTDNFFETERATHVD